MKLVITESQLKKIVKNKVNKSMNENTDGPTNKVILVSVESDDGNYEVDFDVLKVFSNSGAARNYTNYLRDSHKGGTPFMQEFEVLNSFEYEEKFDDSDEDMMEFEGMMGKFKPQNVKEQSGGNEYSKQLDLLIKKYSNTGLCDVSGMKKVFPYDEEVKKLQVLINKGEGKPVVKEDGMLGPQTKHYICSGGI